MKTVFFLGILFVCLASLAYAHGKNDLVLHGILIDNACAAAHPGDLAAFVKSHDKTCLLKPNCMKAGYSILAEEDGKLYKFDEVSNQDVAEFLKNPNNRTDVVIIAEHHGEALMIERIRNKRIVH